MSTYRYQRLVIPGPNGTQHWHNAGDDNRVHMLEEAEGYTYVHADGDLPPQPDTVSMEPAALDHVGNRVSHFFSQVGSPVDAPNWQQPFGAGDPTMPMQGDWRQHKGLLWESLIDSNVYEPGVVGTWRQPLVPFPQWIQPPGAGTGYPVGFGVTHNALRWINEQPDNTYEPGVWGWVLDEGQEAPQAPGIPEWAAGTAYTAGDEVTYEGTTYTCLQGHTAIVGWEPPNVPALWSPA